MSQLHPNAAVRVIRLEIVRLTNAREELMEAAADPRIPLGVCKQQIDQCEREMGELVDALRVLFDHAESQRSAA